MRLDLIHQDSRGSISTLKSDFIWYPELTLFATNEGYARGGCVHNLNNEFVSVISGKIEYVVGQDKVLMRDGDSTIIPKGTPHYFISYTDSFVLEWGASEEEKKVKHSEYRKIVERINDKSN